MDFGAGQVVRMMGGRFLAVRTRVSVLGFGNLNLMLVETVEMVFAEFEVSSPWFLDCCDAFAWSWGWMPVLFNGHRKILGWDQGSGSNTPGKCTVF